MKLLLVHELLADVSFGANFMPTVEECTTNGTIPFFRLHLFVTFAVRK